MCDYSLHAVASRPAKVGDKLVTTKFANTFTRGFADIGEPGVAVCLLPGTEIAFDAEATCDHFLGFIWRLSRKHFGKVARFRQINQQREHVHHDALEFPGGQTVLLTRLSEGQNATVLQLPALPRAVKEVEKRAHPSTLV
jgi:hypothetical protein